jgi:hypothetical protein
MKGGKTLYIWKVLKISAMQGSPSSRIDFSCDEESVTLLRARGLFVLSTNPIYS